MTKQLFIGLITMALLAACSTTTPQPPAAQMPGATTPTIQVPDGANAPLTPTGSGNDALLAKGSKLSSALLALSTVPAATSLSPQSAPASSDELRPNAPRRVNGGTVTVNAVPSASPEALLAKLQGLGLQSGSTSANMVSGRLPVSALKAAGALPELQGMRLALAATSAVHSQAYSFPSQGLVVSQGDVAQRSDIARQKYRVSGAGVTVGVLSDSFNCGQTTSTTATQDVQNGDLPKEGVQVIEELNADECAVATNPSVADEGRALLQVVHDVAPSARLSFASAYNGEASFANNIEKLAAAGADVIVDDVLYYDEPYFQDGIVAQAVNRVAKQGVAYFAAAGNQYRASYEGAFNPSGQSFNGCELHNFASGGTVDTLQGITLPAGAAVDIDLQWDQPFASASRAGRGSASDVDLFLFNSEGKLLPTDVKNDQITVSADDNVGGDPLEHVHYTNRTGARIQVNLAMTLCSGPQPTRLKWIDFGYYGYKANIEYATDSPTSVGHNNAAGAAGVGAARYSLTPPFGQTPPLLERYSSAGGVPLLFDLNGRRLAKPEVRQQPRFTAPDGGNTSFFGFPSAVDGDAFPNFFGTSVAASHAAGVAALMLEGATTYGGPSRPADIYDALAKSAIDMNTLGYDADSGAGLIQADQALGLITGQ